MIISKVAFGSLSRNKREIKYSNYFNNLYNLIYLFHFLIDCPGNIIHFSLLRELYICIYEKKVSN